MNSQGLMRLFSAALVADSYLECLGTDTPSLLPRVDDTLLALGNGTNSFDLRVFGNTSSDYVTWDASASQLIFTGAASLSINGVVVNHGVEVVTTTNVIAASESGTTFFLNAAGGFTSTLPAPAAGLFFRFVVKTAPTTAYIITTTSGADLMYGMMLERAGTAGVAGAARDTFNFVANQAIIGDWVEFISDGTNWYYHGMVDVAVGNTVAAT